MSDDSQDQQPRRPAKKKSSNSTVIIVVILSVAVGGLSIVACCGVALLLPAVQAAREAARRAQSQNNLRQQALAAHNFHDLRQAFPSGPAGNDVTYTEGIENPPARSWRSQMLPFLDYDFLYESIDKTQPWDSPVNEAVFSEPMPVFLNPGVSTDEVVNGYGISNYEANSQVFTDDRVSRIRAITDGLSNTLIIGEINAAYPPWAKPGTQRDPANGLGGGPNAYGAAWRDGVVNFVFADGAVQTLSPDIDREVLSNLANPQDGNGGSPF
ncbi:DUF1559 family PulG-like putative transporter [Stratiformator vulcanicus]|uniref:DUF1559 domain-containing protein n=1 Tax=Stratiformator vulcanicus TaxID=2527980 RepID=A0A517R0U2_9PLAN|nr:DUF1559 domain-containing protein [Stratiformator vulcanicus]QDT37450.1 hypothetical protein Pan189_18300 [Stratiformator vulcanicus]